MAEEEQVTLGDAQKAVVASHLTDGQIEKASKAAAWSATAGLLHDTELRLPRNMEEWMNLYANHIWSYASVFAIANAIAQLPMTLQKKSRKTGEFTNVESHPILDVLANPSPEKSGYDLVEGTLVNLETCGNAYWEITYGTKTKKLEGRVIDSQEYPMELYGVRPDYLTPEPDKGGKGIKRYKYQIKKYTKAQYFAPEEIVPFHYFHPTKDFLGLGSLQPAVDDILQDKEMSKWNLDFFKHGTVPEGFITTDKTLTPKEIKDLGAQIKQFLAGEGRKILILSRNLQYKPVSVAQREIDFFKGRQESRQSVLAGPGVPPAKAGLLEHAKYDNYKLQMAAFHRDTIVPKLRKLEGALNNFLLKRFPSLAMTDEIEYVLTFDTTALLKEDEDKAVNRYIVMFEHALMTRNEIRKSLGMEKVEDADGDVYYIKSNIAPIGQEPPEESLEAREDEVVKKIDEMQSEVIEGMDEMEERITERLREELLEREE